jgi:hypothetical protein
MKTRVCFNSSLKNLFNLKSFWLVLSLLLASSAWGQTSSSGPIASLPSGADYILTSGGSLFSNITGVNVTTGGSISTGSSSRPCRDASRAGYINIGGNGAYATFQLTGAQTISKVVVVANLNGSTPAGGYFGFGTSSTMTEWGYSSINANDEDCLYYEFTPSSTTTYTYFTLERNNSNSHGLIGIGGQSINLFEVHIWIAASNSPTLTVTPTSITNLTKNIATGGTASVEQFIVNGSNLIANAIVNAPAGFEISLNGTTGWGTTQTITLGAGGSITDVPVYVRISSTTTGSVGPANVTVESTDATPRNVAVSGTVVNLTPLTCPATMTVSDITFSGATFTWDNVANNNGYTIKVYKAGVQVSSEDVAMNATSYNITGLDQLTAYTARLTVKGDGSNSGNSVECAAQAFTTTKAPASGKMTCWTEDFETLAPSANANSNACPAAGETTNELRYNADSGTPSGTSRCETGPFSLLLPSGTWTNGYFLGASGAGHGGSSRSLFMRNTSGTITLPTLDNPRSVSFYVYAKGAVINPARGLKILKDGSVITTNIKIDDSDYLTTDGLIRFASAGWHKVWVEVNSNTQTTVSLQVTGDSSMDIWLDDFTMECSSMLLEAAPNAGGMNYVVDMGPSPNRTFTITANDLPNESGSITLNNLGNFQVSFDNGATWSTGTSASFTYNTSSFAKAVMVRLKAGLSVSEYSTTVTVSCPGYTKVAPTVRFSGKVTLLPSTLPCGEEVMLLNMRGSDDSRILYDYVLGINWTGDAISLNNHYGLKKNQQLSSPVVSLSDLDLKEISFYVQPKGDSGSTTLSLSIFGSGGSFAPRTWTLPQRVPSHITVDLSNATFSDFYVQFGNNNYQDIEIWDIKVIGVPKRAITLSVAMLEGFESSSLDCKSDPQSFLVIGTCLVDGGNITFSSNVSPSQYEFSFDGTTWSQTTLPYTGKYPSGGKRVYVRQLGTAGTAAFNVTETVSIGNNGIGAATIMLTGTVTPPGDMQIPASAAFSSPSGVASIRSIPLLGGEFCQPLTVTHNCTNLTLANCEGGTYAASTSFAIEDIDRTLYLKYTPGANLNCTLTLTSGSFTATIPITWTGATSISNGVATDNTNVKYAAAEGFGRTNVWKAGALPDATVVTITSADFEVSMGNPDYGDFLPLTSAKLGDLRGALFIRQKGAATSGTITLTTAGGQTTTINVTVQ